MARLCFLLLWFHVCSRQRTLWKNVRSWFRCDGKCTCLVGRESSYGPDNSDWTIRRIRRFGSDHSDWTMRTGLFRLDHSDLAIWTKEDSVWTVESDVSLPESLLAVSSPLGAWFGRRSEAAVAAARASPQGEGDMSTTCFIFIPGMADGEGLRRCRVLQWGVGSCV